MVTSTIRKEVRFPNSKSCGVTAPVYSAQIERRFFRVSSGHGGIVPDIDASDTDGDGDKDIVINRTGSGDENHRFL